MALMKEKESVYLRSWQRGFAGENNFWQVSKTAQIISDSR